MNVRFEVLKPFEPMIMPAIQISISRWTLRVFWRGFRYSPWPYYYFRYGLHAFGIATFGFMLWIEKPEGHDGN
jgi:hypothetical protein